jgi:DNA replication protein DnaC
MERIKMPKNLRNNITLVSETCDKHHKPIQKMMFEGEPVCPICMKEQWDLELTAKVNAEIQANKQNAAYNILFDKSILEDNTLLNARVHNFLSHGQEEAVNKQKVQLAIKRYQDGEVFNLILQGNPGAGKSHLAYSTLFELNETHKFSCLFISVGSMLRKIRASFKDKESKYTEEYFNRLLSDVDFLVLDDIGAETGAITSDKTATDFVQRVLYDIANARQGKPTILTTNLDGKTLFNMYDSKLVSRLMRNPEVVIFKESKDKRITTLF